MVKGGGWRVEGGGRRVEGRGRRVEGGEWMVKGGGRREKGRGRRVEGGGWMEEGGGMWERDFKDAPWYWHLCIYWYYSVSVDSLYRHQRTGQYLGKNVLAKGDISAYLGEVSLGRQAFPTEGLGMKLPS